ncbi:MAG: DUF4259 domain-containing protein [Burkholderiales bacterium]
MGTWSTLPFGNDDAADWAYELEDADDLAPIDEAVSVVLAVGDAYLEAFEAAAAVAAIELLTCLGGRPGDTETYTEAADAWLKRVEAKPPPELMDKARSALSRVLADDSELHELWRDSEDYEQWLEAMADLRARLADN